MKILHLLKKYQITLTLNQHTLFRLLLFDHNIFEYLLTLLSFLFNAAKKMWVISI